MNRNTIFTAPTQAIALNTLVPVTGDSAYRMEVTDDQYLAVYTITTPPADSVPLQDPAEPYTGFHEQVQQVLKDADAISNDEDRQRLHQVLYKYKDSFAKGSLDCGLTDIHMVHIPTQPGTPPTYVRQYKIPLESYELV